MCIFKQAIAHIHRENFRLFARRKISPFHSHNNFRCDLLCSPFIRL